MSAFGIKPICRFSMRTNYRLPRRIMPEMCGQTPASRRGNARKVRTNSRRPAGRNAGKTVAVRALRRSAEGGEHLLGHGLLAQGVRVERRGG
jgi:hypothetical protein